MKSITLATRVLALNLFVSVIIILGLFAYFERVNRASRNADASHAVNAEIDQAVIHFNEMTIGMRGFMLDPSMKEEWDQKLQADKNAVESFGRARQKSINTELTAKIDAIAALDEKMDALENQFGSLVANGKYTEAKKFYFSNYQPVRKQMEGILLAAEQIASSDAKHYSETEEQMIQAGAKWLSGLIFIALLGSLLVNQAISNKLTKKLAGLSAEMSTSAMSIELASKSTAAASQQIATSATENASAITETLSMTDVGRKESDHGREVVANLTTSMREVFEANSKLETLIKVIEDIRSKTKVINDIVFETRLLSFNAAIEAARAGAHGKGFAVVAEEVGKLAAVSGKAADEIHTLLEESTQQVRGIVSTTGVRVNAARESSAQCEQVFNQMSISLNEINRAMQDMEKETHQNSASAEEMANQASTLAHESKALTTLVVNIRSLVLGNQESQPQASAVAAAPAVPQLKIVKPSPSDQEVGRNDIRWKTG